MLRTHTPLSRAGPVAYAAAVVGNTLAVVANAVTVAPVADIEEGGGGGRLVVKTAGPDVRGNERWCEHDTRR